MGSAVRSEMKKFVEEHRLSQGILLTYAPLSTTGDLIQTEIRLGRRKVEDLKRRIASLPLSRAMPVVSPSKWAVLHRGPHPQLGWGGTLSKGTKGQVMHALCMDLMVMRKKNGTEDQEVVLSLPFTREDP